MLTKPIQEKTGVETSASPCQQEKPGQTLDATALVHEAYLRLVGDEQFANRRHFFAAAAEAMRRILIDRARFRRSLKRGGNGRRVTLDGLAPPDPDDRLLALDEALTQLAGAHPLVARVVEMHHFAGARVIRALQSSIGKTLRLSESLRGGNQEQSEERCSDSQGLVQPTAESIRHHCPGGKAGRMLAWQLPRRVP